ncbi:MAG: outer membrane protein assembly factor BamD [Pseudomonadota bacterium]
MRALLTLAIVVLLAGCKAGPDDGVVPGSVADVYQQAERSMESGNYPRAIFILQQIQNRFPFSNLGRQASVDLIYCYYKSGRTEEAIDAADQFMRENPTSPLLDYALYIKGLTYFDEEPGRFTKMMGVDRAARPPAENRQALATFLRLLDRYPSSEYADDARQRVLFLKERLARYENYVADFYLRRGAYVAALNRAKQALEQFDGAQANLDSLRIMAVAYDELNLPELAADTRKVLAENERARELAEREETTFSQVETDIPK